VWPGTDRATVCSLMWTTRRRRHSPQVTTTTTTTALLPTRARLPSRRPTLLRPSTRAARSARYFTNIRTERTHTHVQRPFVRDPQVSRYQKGKTSLDFTEARDSGSGISWARCKSAPCSRQITHASTPPLSFLQAGCPSCRPTNSVKVWKVGLQECSENYNK